MVSNSLKLMKEASQFMADLDAIDPRIFEEIENLSSSESLDWRIASIIWENALAGKENALAMVHELFVNKDEIQMFLEHSKLEQSQKSVNEAIGRKTDSGVMTFSAIAIIGFGLSDKRGKFLQLERR